MVLGMKIKIYTMEIPTFIFISNEVLKTLATRLAVIHSMPHRNTVFVRVFVTGSAMFSCKF